MNYLVQKTFENRGYTEEFIKSINDPSYDKLKDIDLMAVRLKEIHDDHLPVTIYPDFDMDGIAAGTLGFAGMAELGFNVNLYIPNPEEGYGITINSIADLLSKYPDTKVIITCDTGITADEAAAYCRRQGVEFLVTDHHMQKNVIDADIIVDPMRLDESYNHPEICGAFVLYQVLQYYADFYCNSFTRDQIRRLRLFAGMGTISDTMPVLYANRQLVKDSIIICRYVYGDGTADAVSSISGCNIYRRAFWGLFNFLKVCEKYGIIKTAEDITEDFFGYYLAPMFNSPKRMNGIMENTFGVFFANTSEQCADYLYNLNIERKELVEREMKAILSQPQPYAPYVYFTTARAGILGLLATKLMAMTGMPTFVAIDYGEGTEGSRYSGSGRSPEWYPCITHLNDVISIAGHEFAFGWSCDDAAALDYFVATLKSDVSRIYSSVSVIEPTPDFIISTDWTADVGIDIDAFDDYLNEIYNYHPFGKGFAEPFIKFVFRNCDVVEWKTIGSAKQHLKISFANGFDVLCWNQAHLIKQKDSFNNHVVYGHLGKSEFKGLMSINFVGNFVEQ